MATDPKALGATTEQESMERFGTPLPGADPASQQEGVRRDPNYIGATNFAKIQQKYTPFQIESATRRDDQGNIFWNPDVNIADIPASAPAGQLTKPAVTTPTADNIMRGATGTGALTVDDQSFKLSAAASSATQGYLTGINKRLDDLTNTQQQMVERQKAEAKTGRANVMDRLREISGTTAFQKRLQTDREAFQVEKTIATLNTVKQKMADASNALNQGLIYEESQPVRMGLLVGRSNELKKQGLAHIGALQATAEILQGNIDLARAYADQSLSAIRADNAEQRHALDTLLNMYDQDLIQLSKDEKNLINYRKNLLEGEADRMNRDKDTLLGFAEKNPDSFAKAGVTFMDTPEAALQKMLPYLSEMERLSLENARLGIERSRAMITKAQRTGTGGGAGSSLVGEIATAVSYFLDEGRSQDEIRRLIYGRYGDSLKTTEIERVLDSSFSGAPKSVEPDKPLTPADILKQKKAEAELKELGLSPTGEPLSKGGGGGVWERIKAWGANLSKRYGYR